MFAAFGTLGVVVPLLPTTPLYLVALWAYFKASPRRARRLLRHPRYGPVLRAWIRHKAIPRKAKWLATFLLTLSWFTLLFGGMHLKLLLFPGMLFLCMGIFIWTRPEFPVHTGNSG